MYGIRVAVPGPIKCDDVRVSVDVTVGWLHVRHAHLVQQPSHKTQGLAMSGHLS
jgi:hypothetical protein